MPLLIMVSVFPEKQILCLQDTLMQIGLEMLMIGKAPLVVISVECYTFKLLNLHMLSSEFCYSLMFCVVFVFSCILQVLEENPSNSKIRTKSGNSFLDRFNSNQFRILGKRNWQKFVIFGKNPK
jgi:hypothetical protein